MSMFGIYEYIPYHTFQNPLHTFKYQAMDSSRKYTTSNSIAMLACKPLNWQIAKKYKADTAENPELYVINVGGIADMWQALYNPETSVLSFTSMHYSNHEVYRFLMNSIEEASELVLKFAMGMGIKESLDGTIYTTVV